MSADQRLSRAEHLIEVRRVADARALLASALAERPDDATAHRLMSRAVAKDDPGESLRHARAAVAADPEDPDNHLALSAALACAGHAHDSAVAAHEAVRLAPHSPVAKRAYASRLRELPGGHHLALTMARQAVSEAPNDAGGWVTLGQVQHISDPVAARGCYEHALALDPSLAVAVQNIAAIDHNRSHLGPAIRGFATALSMDPTLTVARDNLSRSLNRAVLLGVVALLVGIQVALHSSKPLIALGAIALTTVPLVAIALIRLPRGVRRSLGVTLAPGFTRCRSGLTVIALGVAALAAGTISAAAGGSADVDADLGGGGVAVIALGAILVSLSMRRLRQSQRRA